MEKQLLEEMEEETNQISSDLLTESMSIIKKNRFTYISLILTIIVLLNGNLMKMKHKLLQEEKAKETEPIN